MAAAIRDHDWSATPLGSIDTWPPELRSTVMLILDSAFPAALVWGDELVTLYNDGFTRILGNKPNPLGRPFAEIFHEAWHRVGPIVERAYAGEATFIADFPVTIDRSGRPEQAFFTFSCSPVRRADGSVAGMIDIVTETTPAVIAREQLAQSERYYRALVTAGAHSIYRMSADWRLMYQLDSDTLSSTAAPNENWVDKYILEDDRPAVFAAIAHAIANKSLFELEHRVLLADGSVGWVLSRAVPLLDPDGRIIEWFGAGTDVTERRNAVQQLRDREARDVQRLEAQVRERTAELERSRDLLRGTMDASTDMIQVFAAVRDEDGQIVDFKWVLNNHTSESRFGEVKGRSLLERNPGVIVEGILDAFKRVTETGEAEQAERHYAHEQFDGWFLQTVVKLGDGVATTTKDITDWKTAQAEILRLQEEAAQARLEESEGRFRTLADTAPAMIWQNDENGGNLFVNRYLLDFTGKAAEDVAGPDWYDIIHPDDAVAYAESYMDAVRERRAWQNRNRLRRHDGAWHWFDNFAQPLFGHDGAFRGHVGVSIDIQATVEAEATLRESEERLRQFGEASQDILWIRDAATLQWIYLTPAFEAIYGLTREEALAGDDNYRTWQKLILPEDRDHALRCIAAVQAGRRVSFEYRIRRQRDGAIRWLRNTDFPIREADGQIRMIGGIGQDFTEIREAELRFRTLVEGLPQLVWRAVNEGDWTWASPQWVECTGQSEVHYAGWGWLDAVHPDDQEAARAAWSRAFAEAGFTVEHRLRRQDGQYRWFQTRAAPVRDEEGRIIEWFGTSTDIGDLLTSRELQQTLLAELQHRVRNILAVTRSIVRRSADAERSVEDYIQHLEGRISALARTQVMLTRHPGAGVDLEDMVRDELLVQAASEDQFSIDGPDVELSPKAAEVLTLAVHELATNATKYGAFSRDGGTLDLSWTVERRDGCDWLLMHWQEHGVSILESAPRRQGFGTELIARRIPYELKGHGSFELKPGGVVCRIEFPLIPGESILQTDGV